MYEYQATVVRVVDGDTVRLKVDLGFFLSYEESFRLFGIDTPEIKGSTKAVGLASKAFVENLLPAGMLVWARTTKADKYGRWLATLYREQGKPSINQQILDANLAKAYFGGKKA